jgi:hypothetical protein
MRRTVPAIAALSVGVALTLSGCFANPLEQLTDGLIEGGVEQIIEDQTGVDVDVDGSGASLPDSWPADVPTLQGDVVFSAAAGGTFTAAITVPSIADAQQAFTDLLDAGYTQVSELQLGEGSEARVFENGTWNVALIIAENAEGTGQVQYTIAPVTQ